MRHRRHKNEEHEHEFFADVATTTPKTFPISAQLIVLSVLLLTIFGTGLMPKIVAYFDKQDNTQTATIPLTDREGESEWNSEENSSFNNIEIIGESAFVYDVRGQKVLYEKNPDARLPLASITKLMTALVAYEIVSEDTTVPISYSAILQDGNSGFTDGDRFSLSSLMELTLTSSSNDGAYAMAAAVGAMLDKGKPATTFVEAMNIRAQELGLTQTSFKNPTGLDISEREAGALGSARDVAFLMDYILKNQPDILELTTNPSVMVADEGGSTYQVNNTNNLIGNISGLIGSKTGYTTLAGGNLTIAYDASLNRPIIVVVLGSSRSGRFLDVSKLVDASRDYVN